MLENKKNSKLGLKYIILIIFILSICFSAYFYIYNNQSSKANLKAINGNIDTAKMIETINKRNITLIKASKSNLQYIELDDENKLITDDIITNKYLLTSLSRLLVDNDDTTYKFIYYYENRIYIYDLYEAFNFFFKHNHEYYLTDSTGLIKVMFRLDLTNLVNTNINNIINDVTLSPNFNIDNVYLTKQNNKLVTYTKLENLDIYLVQIVPKDAYDVISNIVLITVLILIVIIATLIFVFYVFKKKQKENRIESINNLLMSKFSNFYFTTVDKKGLLLNYNYLFEELFIKGTITSIYELEFLENSYVVDDRVIMLANDEQYIFNIIKFQSIYILVGENYSSLINKKNNELYLHQDTSIPNEKSFKEYITKMDHKLDYTFLIVDIKQYKSIVFRHGEKVGNDIIRIIDEFSKKIRTKESTKLFQIKNDTFIIIIESNPNVTIDEKWFDEVLYKLNLEIYENYKLNINFRSGVLNSTSSLLKTPDLILVILKELLIIGKSNNFTRTFYDSAIEKAIFSYRQMKVDIEHAIVKDEFVMYLQPILNLETLAVCSFEALIRWDNPTYINVSPASYIKLAEESDLIFEIGLLVIKKTIKIIKESVHKDLVVTINISPKQFMDNNFVNNLISEVYNNNISPHQLSIEVTETIFVKDSSKVVTKLELLKKLGFTVYLDDFGTGYSSLKYLNDLPVDVIKIDRVFINNMLKDEKNLSLVKTVINLAHGLDLLVVAEGVETLEQLEMLKQMGCDFIQGYLISKPLEYSKALNLYNKDFSEFK